MATDNEIMQRMIDIQNLIISKKTHNENSSSIKRFDRLLELIKGVGVIDKVRLNGSISRFLIIDGISWKRASDELLFTETPDFVMLDEGHFFELLQNQLNE